MKTKEQILDQHYSDYGLVYGQIMYNIHKTDADSRHLSFSERVEQMEKTLENMILRTKHLSREEIHEMRAMYRNGTPIKAIAIDYKVHYQTAWQQIKFKNKKYA